MKRRDRLAVSIYRTALAAIDNAEAVPVTDQHHASAIETSATGAGTSDAPRRSLTEADMVAIVRAEIENHRSAADELHDRDRSAASRLHDGAEMLDQMLSSYPSSD